MLNLLTTFVLFKFNADPMFWIIWLIVLGCQFGKYKGWID